MDDIKPTSIPRERQIIKEDSFVILSENHNLHNGDCYNYEYNVLNEITGFKRNFHHYYDGGDIKGNAEKLFAEQVEVNKRILGFIENRKQ